MKYIVTIVALCLSVSVAAQEFLISNVTLFDGEKVLENTSVLVQDGSIVEVGKDVKADVHTIDGTGKFLMPGMTNCHIHAWNALSLKEAASAGVLNVMDMHGMEQFQKGMKSLGDSTNYARYYYAGYAATAPGGHGTQFGFPIPTLTEESQAVGFVTDRLEAGASYIKIIVEPWKPTLSHDIVKTLIAEAHKQGTLAVVHVSRKEDAIKVLANNADALVHIWWDEPISSEELKEIVTNNNFVIPTLLTTHLALNSIRKNNTNKEYFSNEDVSKEVFKLYRAGVPILAGTDPPNLGINYGTDLHKELKLLREAGIPAIDVLKSATSHPAKYFQLENTGSIKSGYLADMVLLSENPMENMTHLGSIERIWKAGKPVNVSQ